MSDFAKALQFVLKHEGTTLYEDQETHERSKYGITQTLLKSLKYKITDPNILTINDVNFIYESTFWSPNKFEQINSQLAANKVFDMTINMKYSYGVRLLQASLNMLGALCVIDGAMGPHTIVTVNQYTSTNGNEEKLLNELVLQSISYYKRIAIGPLAKDLPGWTTRAEDTGLPQADKVAFSTLRDGSSDKTKKG